MRYTPRAGMVFVALQVYLSLAVCGYSQVAKAAPGVETDIVGTIDGTDFDPDPMTRVTCPGTASAYCENNGDCEACRVVSSGGCRSCSPVQAARTRTRRIAGACAGSACGVAVGGLAYRGRGRVIRRAAPRGRLFGRSRGGCRGCR